MSTPVTITVPGTPSAFVNPSYGYLTTVTFAIPAGTWTAAEFSGTSSGGDCDLIFLSGDRFVDGSRTSAYTQYGVLTFPGGGLEPVYAAGLSAIQAAAGSTLDCLMTYGDGTAGDNVVDIALVLTGTVPPPVTTASLSAPATACTGTSVLLSYATAGADMASINNGVGTVAPDTAGTISTGPLTAGTHTFLLSASSAAGGAATASATVTVADCNTCIAAGLLDFAPPAVNVTCALVANRPSITAGDSSDLLLTTTGAALASLDNGIGPVMLSGLGNAAITVTPSVTITYDAVAQGAWLTQAFASATVTVAPAPPPDLCGCEWTQAAAPARGSGWTKKGC